MGPAELHGQRVWRSSVKAERCLGGRAAGATGLV